MSILIDSKNDEKIEIDSRIIKFSFRSRVNYSIDTVTLEIILIQDIVIINKELIIYLIYNLEAYYNWILLNIGCLVLDVVGD